ncbi:MAG: hypothetical protein H7196_04865 [candidate division SR1 bacterium]|nr:hypothetical protein [candidate division SR1 bacterium]
MKQLPTIGDSNWGIPLNSYITQTTDNANGGTFNSFTNFADRPTNLTADDKGKTYLNNRTGNFHTWIGTAWVVKHTGGFINVQDIGKAGYNDNADDSAVVQAAINTAQIDDVHRKLFFPNGLYFFEVEVKGQPGIVITGESTGSTQMAAINPDGYVFTFHANGQHYLENLSINGRKSYDPNLAFNTNGVKCIPKSDSPQNAGYNPVNMSRVTIRGCGVALYKEATLFGRFDNCTFGGDIGIFSKGSTQPAANNNYSGFDYFTHCFFNGNKVAVYYNNVNHTDENQTKFENCWWEGTKGISVLAICTGVTLASLKFAHCWFESNAQNYGQTVNIDGKDYIIREFIFDNSKGVIEHGNLPHGIVLKNRSYLKLDYVQGSEAGNVFDKIEYDASSYLDCYNISEVPSGGYGGVINFMTDFAMRGNLNGNGGENNATNLWKTKNNRSIITRKYKNVAPWGSCASILGVDNGPFTSRNCVPSIISDDGLYNNKCLEVIFPSVNATYCPILQNVDYSKRYIVISLSIKVPNATRANPVRLLIGSGNGVALIDDNWHSYVGVYGDSLGEGALSIKSYNPSSTTILFSKVQIVQFDYYQDATDYAKSDFYALPNVDPISWHDSAFPTTGTYVKGDVIYNTSPTPGGYMGWTCITAGTPGTWKGFGLIEA